MTSSSSPKTFILDTNVILHDSACINNFQEHDVVIPITVIEELDQFKKGNLTLNYHAREFVRALDQIDHPYLDSQSNGLSHLIEKMQGQPLYAHINLEKGERSELAMLASELL